MASPEEISLEFPFDEILLKRGRCEEFYVEYLEMYDKMLDSLKDLKADIQTNQRNCNIAHVTASSAGILSGVSTVAGLFLAPTTFGASLLFTGGGVVGMFLTSSTSIGAMVTEEFLKRRSMKEAQKILNEYKALLENFIAAIEAYANLAADFQEQIKSFPEKEFHDKSTFLKYLHIAFQGTKALNSSRYSIKDLENIWCAYKAAKDAPQLLKLAQSFTKNGVSLSASNLSKIQLAFKGTPLAMTAAARFTQMAIAGVNIAFDAYTLVNRAKELASDEKSDCDKGFDEIFACIDAEREILKQVFETLFYVKSVDANAMETS